MKMPEPFFVVINKILGILLRSPIHGLWSGNLLLITFRGRKSGKKFTTPLRYIRVDDAVQCFSTAHPVWWKNLRGGADVVLRLTGKDRPFCADVIENDAPRIKAALINYLAIFPRDAEYHDVSLNKDGSLVADTLERASHHSIVVEAKPVLR